MSDNKKNRSLTPTDFLEFAKEMVAFEWHQESDEANKVRSAKSVASLEDLAAAQNITSETPKSASVRADTGNVMSFKKRSTMGKK